MSFLDVETFQQLFTYFQKISLPESYYLYLEKWHIYFIALIGILMLGIFLYLVHLLLKLFFFRYVFNSQDMILPILNLSYFFFVYAIVFVLFGAFWRLLGFSIPDKFGSMKLMGAFAILTVVLG